MSKTKKIISYILAIAMLATTMFADADAGTESKREAVVSRAGASEMQNGVYEAQGRGFDYSGSGNIIASVKIDGGKYKEIKILRHRKLNGDVETQTQNLKKVEKVITEKVIAEQKADYSKAQVEEILKPIIQDFQPIPKNQCIEDAMGLLEAIRNSEKASVNGEGQIYLDPELGSDTNNGKSTLEAVKSFERAKALLPTGGKIVLVSTIRIGEDENTVLSSKEGAALTVQRQAGFSKMLIQLKGVLEIKDLTLDGLSRLVSKDTIVSVTGVSNAPGTLTLKKGAVLQNNYTEMSGGAVHVGSGGKVIMEDGKIQNNTTLNRGGGVCIDSCDFIMKGGVISNNRALISGGNDSGSGGGIINIGSEGKGLILNGGEIKENYAEKRGGAIAGSYQILKMTGGKIENNISKNGAGAISDIGYYWSQPIVLTGGSITGNTGKKPAVDIVPQNTIAIGGGLVIADNTSEDKPANLLAAKIHVIKALSGQIFCNNDTSLIEGGKEVPEGAVYKLTADDAHAFFSDEGLTPYLQPEGNRIVFVSSSDEGIKISRNYLVLQAGEKQKLTANSIPVVEGETFTWQSDNSDIAKVDNQGEVEGVSKGKTFIRVTNSKGKTATCRVVVTSKSLPENIKNGIYTGRSKSGPEDKKITLRVYVKGGRIQDIVIVKHNENLIEIAIAKTFIDGILHQYTLDRPFIPGHEEICGKVVEAIEEALKSEPYEAKPLTTVYLDPVKGDDIAFGYSAEQAVKSFDKAVELTDKSKASTIKLLNTIKIDEKEVLDSRDASKRMTLKRAKGFKGGMIEVSKGGLTLRNIIIDGNKREVPNSSAVIKVAKSSNKKDFAVRLKEGVEIRNNKSAGASVIRSENKLAGIYLDNGFIYYNESKSGSLIDMKGGDFYMAGGRIRSNKTAYGVFAGKNIGFAGTAYVAGNKDFKGRASNIKLSSAGIYGRLYKKARLQIDYGKTLLKGSKKDVYDKKPYKIVKSDLGKIVNSLGMVAKLSKKANIYLSVRAAKVWGNTYKRSVVINWSKVPYAAAYKVFDGKKLLKTYKAGAKRYKHRITTKSGRTRYLKVVTVGYNKYTSSSRTLKLKAK